MIELVKFSLANAAVSYIITQSFIFNWLRNWTKIRLEKERNYLNEAIYVFFKCPLCIGFWSSLFSLYIFFHINIFSLSFSEVFYQCCIGSITSMIIYSIIKK